jgi:hypothetical protein
VALRLGSVDPLQQSGANLHGRAARTGVR